MLETRFVTKVKIMQVSG